MAACFFWGVFFFRPADRQTRASLPPSLLTVSIKTLPPHLLILEPCSRDLIHIKLLSDPTKLGLHPQVLGRPNSDGSENLLYPTTGGKCPLSKASQQHGTLVVSTSGSQSGSPGFYTQLRPSCLWTSCDSSSSIVMNVSSNGCSYVPYDWLLSDSTPTSLHKVGWGEAPAPPYNPNEDKCSTK